MLLCQSYRPHSQILGGEPFQVPLPCSPVIVSPRRFPDKLIYGHEGLCPFQLPRLVPQKFGELRQQAVPVAGSGVLVQVPGSVGDSSYSTSVEYTSGKCQSAKEDKLYSPVGSLTRPRVFGRSPLSARPPRRSPAPSVWPPGPPRDAPSSWRCGQRCGDETDRL